MKRVFPVAGRRRDERGFTLTELMIASSISLVMVGGVLLSQIYGLRMFEVSGSVMDISKESRRVLGRLTDDIHSARTIRIGNGGTAGFLEVSRNLPRLGNALQLSASTNTNVYVRYFYDSGSRSLRRMSNGGPAVILARWITNTALFSLEDFRGVVLTNTANNCIVGVGLEFDPQRISSLRWGTGSYYTAYQVRTKVAHRKGE